MKIVYLLTLMFCLTSCSKQESQLNGSVFIVTNNRDNIKLGLVPIMLLERTSFNAAIALVQSNKQNIVEQGLEGFDKEVEETRILRKNLLEINDTNDVATLQRDTESVTLDLRLGECSGYFKNLPPPLLFTKTDADGKFRFIIPKEGDFVIAATASRQVGDRTEKYFWLIKASLHSKTTTEILLSNDNLLTADSPQSVIKLASDKFVEKWKTIFPNFQ